MKKLKEENQQPRIYEIIRRNLSFVIIITIVYILSALTVLITPRGFEIPELSESYVLFGPSLSALILLLVIGGYLIYRYLSKPSPKRESLFQLIWGVSFLLYSITFLGLCLQSLNFEPSWQVQ